jgi:hypothetical protein
MGLLWCSYSSWEEPDGSWTWKKSLLATGKVSLPQVKIGHLRRRENRRIEAYPTCPGAQLYPSFDTKIIGFSAELIGFLMDGGS